MKQYSIQIFSLIIFLILFSCSSREKIVGVYEAKNFIRTIDTLMLNSDYSYNHTVFEKKTKKNIYVNVGSWEINNGKIHLSNFLFNEDDVSFDESINLNRFLIDGQMDIEGIWENKIIIWKDMNFYYKKITAVNK